MSYKQAMVYAYKGHGIKRPCIGSWWRVDLNSTTMFTTTDRESHDWIISDQVLTINHLT